MKDLTKDSIPSHLLRLSAPILIGMVTQIAYQVVDLYFIAKISVAATAGVNAGGNAVFIVAALAAILNVGTAPLVAHAVGRKDRADANFVFNQSLTLSIALGAATAALLYVFRRPYLESIAADAATIEAGSTFILWMLPGLALICPMAGLTAALRGTGTVQPPVFISMFTVILNAMLAPVLIGGWGTGVALGVKGAGLASSISIGVGIILLAAYFHRYERYLTIDFAMLRPRLHHWRRIFVVGAPAGGEFTLTFLSMAVVYFTIRDLGVAAQAGFGIGARVLQVILLPVMAISFAVGPIAAQNFGAGHSGRVLRTFREAALIGTAIMFALMLLVQWRPHTFVSMFDADPGTTTIAVLFLQWMSWSFVAQGLVYVCSSMFQGLGNTLPSLISSSARFVVLCICAIWLSLQPTFSIEQVWYVLIATAVVQAMLSLLLLKLELDRRLPGSRRRMSHDGSYAGSGCDRLDIEKNVKRLSENDSENLRGIREPMPFVEPLSDRRRSAAQVQHEQRHADLSRESVN